MITSNIRKVNSVLLLFVTGYIYNSLLCRLDIATFRLLNDSATLQFCIVNIRDSTNIKNIKSYHNYLNFQDRKERSVVE